MDRLHLLLGILLVLKTSVGVSVSTKSASVSSESMPGEHLSSPLTSTSTQTDDSPFSLQQNSTDNNQQLSNSAQLSSFLGVAVGTISGATAVGGMIFAGVKFRGRLDR